MTTETTTDTEVLPELDEKLDFEVVCEADHGCENVAKWLAITSCPHHPFICDPHRAQTALLALLHQKVVCNIENCGAPFCLCEVVWRHL